MTQSFKVVHQALSVKLWCAKASAAAAALLPPWTKEESWWPVVSMALGLVGGHPAPDCMSALVLPFARSLDTTELVDPVTLKAFLL